jgi:hypothetical protein
LISQFYLGGNGSVSSVILATRDAASWRIPRIRTEKNMSLSLCLTVSPAVVQIDKNLISQNAIVLFKQDLVLSDLVLVLTIIGKLPVYMGTLQYKVRVKKGRETR